MRKISAGFLLLMLLICGSGCQKERGAVIKVPVSTVRSDTQNQDEYLTARLAGLYVVSGSYSFSGNSNVVGGIFDDTIAVLAESITDIFFKAGFKELSYHYICFGDSTSCNLTMLTPDSLNSPGISGDNYYFFSQMSNYPVYYTTDAGWKIYFSKNNSDSIYITMSKSSWSCHPVFSLSGVKVR